MIWVWIGNTDSRRSLAERRKSAFPGRHVDATFVAGTRDKPYCEDDLHAHCRHLSCYLRTFLEDIIATYNTLQPSHRGANHGLLVITHHAVQARCLLPNKGRHALIPTNEAIRPEPSDANHFSEIRYIQRGCFGPKTATCFMELLQAITAATHATTTSPTGSRPSVCRSWKYWVRCASIKKAQRHVLPSSERSFSTSRIIYWRHACIGSSSQFVGLLSLSQLRQP